MNKKRENNKNLVFVGILFLFFGCFLFFSNSAFAAVTVTPASGGSSISADTTGGSYTSLTGPVITEANSAEIGTGSIVLSPPAGFVFSTTTNSVTATVTGAGNCGGTKALLLSNASSETVTPTATSITNVVSRDTSNPCDATITWTGIKVRPSAGTPLASGNITKGGTSVITGVTDGSTNFGTLTEVAGAKTKLTITTQSSTSSLVNTDFTTKPVVAIQDQFGNTVTADSSSTVSRGVVLSTQVCGGTSGSGTITSTPGNAATVVSGVMTYTAMQYSVAESIKICFESSGITSTLSNVITVTNPDSIPPTVSSIVIQSPTTINITFSEAMGTGVTTVSNYTISESGKGTVAANPNTVALVSGNTYVLTWSAGALANAADVTITVANAQDLAGNTIGSPNYGHYMIRGLIHFGTKVRNFVSGFRYHYRFH